MRDQNSHSVFISFSFKDQIQVEEIVNKLLTRYNIKYWICTRDVRAGQHYDDEIYEAIKDAGVFVLMQSKSSVESEEVPKEVRLAIKLKKVVIPFVIEDSEWENGIAYQLINTQEIDATRPTLDERIEELAREIKTILSNRYDQSAADETTGSRLVATPHVIPKTIFCGRDKLLADIHEKYAAGERVLFLYGIGGIGKTQIAKQYAKQYSMDYDTVIYATYNGSIREMLLAEMPFTIEPEMIRYTLSNGEKEDDESFLARKVQRIRELSNSRTLVILDNFDVDNDTDLQLLLEGKYHLLVTTRCDYSREYPTLRIETIDSMVALKEVFMKNYQGYDVEEDDPALTELIELVDRHTYTIELLAQHMENSGQTPAEMIAALKARGIMSLDETVGNAGRTSQRAYDNLLKMFQIFSLDEGERRVLMHLSLMPIEGVKERAFRTWMGMDSSRVIRKLEKHGWIVRNTGGIALHPIIKEVVRYKIPATVERIADFLANFCITINEHTAWGYTKEEKEMYAGIALSIRSVLGEITEETFQFYYNTQRLLSYSVNPDMALKIGMELYDFCIKNYSQPHHHTAMTTYAIGWMYQFNTFWPNALQESRVWLEKCYELYKGLTLETVEHRKAYNAELRDLADTYYLLTKAFPEGGTMEAAKRFHQIAVDYSMCVLDEDPHFSAILAGTYIGLSGLYTLEKDYQKALLYGDKSYQIFLESFGENDVDTAHAMAIKAQALYAMQQYREAYGLGEKVLQIYRSAYGESNMWICDMQELMGDCQYGLGEYAAAARYYSDTLSLVERLYAPGAKKLLDLQNKVAQAQAVLA